jgi:hypothetical protein
LTTTTKIFVILVCVLTFIFTPLVISYAAQKENWRQLARNYREELNVAYANERSVMAIAASETLRLKAMQDQQRLRMVDMQQRLADSQEKLASLSRQRDQLAMSEDDFREAARLLSAEMAIKSHHNEKLNEAREQALQRERELRLKNLQLRDAIKEADAKLVVLKQQLRQKVEELAYYRQENKELRAETGVGMAEPPFSAVPEGPAQAAAPASAAPIRGTITQVEGALATVDVGSAAGVRQGMRMVVLRDSSYVCDLEITDTVTPTEAVGRILLERDKRIRPGDKVEDAASFAQR